ncbi:hypothetical protein [Alicyclobacillus fastidiosus]|uniref:hypothetical protein n=1 Tax=Alicyclobacillus fastidiosus TaxID=392011 RepID=UPI0023E96243|nr:hypothetical protein [Alicyclobacillus fastidiosus]GMA66028.1 hypothetical protein GCM10025859_64700 [Alicyclobacillus fastidiosus]
MDKVKMNDHLTEESIRLVYNIIRKHIRKGSFYADDNDLRKETDGRTSEEGLQPGTNT